MKINFQDFVPAVVRSGFFSGTDYEPLPHVVRRANQWVEQTGARVLNIETVLLPNLQSDQDTSQSGIRTSGDVSSHWHQVVRVWHESPTALPPKG